MNEESDFKQRPWQGLIVIPADLITYRVWGKGVHTFTNSFKPSKLNEKVAEWTNKGYSFIKIK